MRAAIYARFSTDSQSVASIEDQARVCRERANDLGLTVVTVHSDQAISGATPVDRRPGACTCVADAVAGGFDVLLVESLDRLSRDHVEQERVIRRLEHRGVRIIGVSDGYDTASGSGRKLLRGVRGLISEAYLDDLRAKTHRGLRGQIERGYHAGGLSFGYRSTVAGYDKRGEPIGHRLEIDPQQATIVRDIFERYAQGWSCQRLAAELNARRVPGPRGGTWCASALYGSPEKGSGILNNELYVGRYVWNRSQWIKDPDTGKRQRFVRPESEWRVEQRPELRIVSDELWNRVSARIRKPRRDGGGKGVGQRPRTLFGGLLKCGLCGGAVIAISAYQYGCAARKDRGEAVCSGVAVARTTVDERLLSSIRSHLLSPAALARVHARIRAAHRTNGNAQRERRIAHLDAEITRLVNAIAAMGISPGLQARLKDAERERAELVEERDAPTREIADVGAAYRRMVTNLSSALRKDSPRARAALAEIFGGGIRLVPEGEAVFAEIPISANRLILRAENYSNGGCGGRI